MPGWGRGHSGQLDPASVYPSVAEKVFQVRTLWGTSRWQERATTGWPALTQIPSHKQCPPSPVPAWRKLGRENGSKWWGKDSGPVMSTGRPRLPASPSRGSAHLTAPGKHPGSSPGHTGASAASFWPWGLRWQGWRRSRSGGPHQAIGAGPPNTSPQPWQGLKCPFSHRNNWTAPRPEGALLQEAGLSCDRAQAQPPCPGLAVSKRVGGPHFQPSRAPAGARRVPVLLARPEAEPGGC